MKKTLTRLTLLSFLFSAFCFIADDLTRFGTTRKDFEEQLVELAAHRTFPGFAPFVTQEIRNTCKAIPEKDRKGAARLAAELTRSFVMSPAFSSLYKTSQKPVFLDADRNSAEWKEKYKSELTAEAESVRYMLSSGALSDQIFEAYTGMLEGFKAQLEAPTPETTDPELLKTFADMKNLLQSERLYLEKVIKLRPLMKSNPQEFVKQWSELSAARKIDEGIRSAEETNRTRLKEADERKNFKDNIRIQLEQFLEVTKDVDYDARLVKQGWGTMEFENPEYVSKPMLWKQCFRLGKTAGNEFRAFATEWLTELR